MCGFTRKTGATLVAEGIDTAASLHTLRELGVEYGQGYVLASPLLTTRH